MGAWNDDPPPFMGPVISQAAAGRVLEAQRNLSDRCGKVIVESTLVGDCPAMLSPGLIDVTEVDGADDVEIFGPLLQLRFVDSFEEAIEEANRTEFGLSAGLFSDDRKRYEQFLKRIRAGVVNWNRQHTVPGNDCRDVAGAAVCVSAGGDQLYLEPKSDTGVSG